MKHLNSRTMVLLLGAMILGGSARANAELSVTFSTRHNAHRGRPYHRYHHPYRYAPVYYAPRHHHVRPYYPVRYYPVVTPVILQPAPVVPAPVVNPSLSGDYGLDLATLRGKLSRLRAIVQYQKDKGIIHQDSYDRFMKSLDGIERDEHARAYDRGGNLTPEDFAELFRRLDETDQDIERALAG